MSVITSIGSVGSKLLSPFGACLRLSVSFAKKGFRSWGGSRDPFGKREQKGYNGRFIT
jgi:hypothetical protein